MLSHAGYLENKNNILKIKQKKSRSLASNQ